MINNYFDSKLKIFGEYFVENNKDNCYIIIDDKKYNIQEYYRLKIKSDNFKIKIKLIEKRICHICFINVHHYHVCLIFQNGILLMLLVCFVCFANAHHYHLCLLFQNGILLLLLIWGVCLVNAQE